MVGATTRGKRDAAGSVRGGSGLVSSPSRTFLYWEGISKAAAARTATERRAWRARPPETAAAALSTGAIETVKAAIVCWSAAVLLVVRVRLSGADVRSVRRRERGDSQACVRNERRPYERRVVVNRREAPSIDEAKRDILGSIYSVFADVWAISMDLDVFCLDGTSQICHHVSKYRSEETEARRVPLCTPCASGYPRVIRRRFGQPRVPHARVVSSRGSTGAPHTTSPNPPPAGEHVTSPWHLLGTPPRHREEPLRGSPWWAPGSPGSPPRRTSRAGDAR